MAIKNGRYKDKNGVVRHFETNENMVIVDNGQKTLKQKFAELLESLSALMAKFTAHETSVTAHEDIRELIKSANDKVDILDNSHEIGSYKSYSDLGLSDKWSSIEDCIGSIPNDSVGVFDIQGNFDGCSGLFPTPSGLVTITKLNANRCYLLFTSSVTDVTTSKVWYSWYRELETVKYSWQKMALSSETQSKLPSEYLLESPHMILNYATARLRFTHSNNQAYIQAGTTDGNNGDMQLTGYNGDKLTALNVNVLNDNATINTKQIATTEYINLSFLNGWENYVGYGRASKVGKLVTITPIRIQSGATTQATALFTLPEGYRPSANLDVRVTVESGTNVNTHRTSAIRFYTNGNVQILYDEVPTGSRLSLPTISFYV